MEDQTKKIRIWLFVMALFAGFSTSPCFAQLNPLIKGFVNGRGADSVTLSFHCIDGEPGDTICLPVTVENFNSIVIMQAEITWNSDVLDFIKVQNPGSGAINVGSDFNLSGPNALKFIPLGLPIAGQTLADGTTLFEICFRIIGIPGSSSCLNISPFFPYEIADVSGIVPSDSVGCCMTVQNAGNLTAFLTSCGPDIVGTNGTIDVSIFGGTASYTITWVDANGMNAGSVIVPTEGINTILSLPAQNYTVTITDALGTIVMYSAEIDAQGLSVITRIKQPTCYKFENGIIWIKPQGGSAPFSYIWKHMTDPTAAGSGFIRNPGDSSQVTSLASGIYSITVEDDNGCKVVVLDTLIYNPFVFTINDQQDATCNGSGDGFIDLTISGAKPDLSGNYTIKGATFNIQTNTITIGLLDPGDYCITVSDQVSQCDTVYCFNIGYTDTIAATMTVLDVSCAGDDDGTVTLRGRTNGIPMPPYSYFIYEDGVLKTSQMNVGGLFTYSSLLPGSYMAVITNSNGCSSDSIPFVINDVPAIQVTVVGTYPDNCFVTGSGDIWFEITNGVGPYILEAGAGFQDADTLFNLNSGNYILTVTDANMCEVTLPIVIPSFDDTEEADISFQLDGVPCEGGELIVLYQGMPIPPNIGILWSNGSTNDTITISGTDTLSVDLVLGPPIFCILNDTVHIDCEVKLDIDITVMQPLCGEGAAGGPYTGTVIADTTNATAPVTWYWSFPDTTNTGIYTGIAPGKYYVTVVDGLDSMAVDSFEIIAPDPIQLAFSNVDSVSCPGICDGTARVIASNGDGNLDYFLYWTAQTPQGDTGLIFDIANLCAGLTEFNVSQDGICFYKDTLEIFAPDSVKIDLVEAIDASCFGVADGSLEVIATGGSPGYSYSWVNGPLTTIQNGLAAGSYHIFATDSKNCMVEDSFTVNQPDTLIADIDISATIPLSCGSSNDGVITLDVSGGNFGGYTYTWSPNVSNTYQAVNLGTGTYAVTVSDPRGCSDTASYTLTAPPPIAAIWPVVDPILCFGDETLFEITTVTGGSGVYQFTINSGPIYDIGDMVFLPAGIYIISVFDDRGCTHDTTYTILEPNPILVSIGPDNPVIDLGDSLYITGTVDQSDNMITNTMWSSNQPFSCEDCAGTWVFNSLPATYTWTVTDENGCTASASILVNVDFDRDVFIPNIFSPNNDGRNDYFQIYTGPGVTMINFLRIYDRWGNLVHEEENQLPSPGGAGQWNGTYDGKPLNPGVYIFTAGISFIDGETLTYKGDITLVK